MGSKSASDLKNRGKSEMWALIKWVGGKDDKKMTAGINVKHIKEFNYEEFLSDENDIDKVYVVEWRDTRKMPLGGWTCYQGMVLAVSSSINVLEKKIKVMDGVESPRPSLIEPIEEHSGASGSSTTFDTEGLEVVQSNDGSNFINKRLRFSDSDVDFQVIEEKSDVGHTDLMNSTAKVTDPQAKKRVLSPTKPSVTQVFITKEYFDNAMKEVKSFMKISMESKSLSTERKHSSSKSKKSEQKKKAENGMKELGDEGSNVFVTQHQWEAAESKATFTAMATSLLASAFSPEVLMKSNYKGGKSKNTDDKSQMYQALDSNIMRAIKKSVENRHENFKDGPFGAAINNACAKLRSKAKKALNEKDAEKNKDKENNQDND